MLEYFFGSRTRLKLLHIFFGSPERPFFVRQLSRLADTQLNAIRREIARLEEAGVIRQINEAPLDPEHNGGERAKYYQLDTGFLLFAELKMLLTKGKLLAEQAIIEEIKKRGGTIKLFLLAGVFTSEPKSETDLLIVGDLKYSVIAKLIKELEKAIGQPVRYTLMDKKEFEERNEIGDVFLYRIFEGKHALVVDEI